MDAKELVDDIRQDEEGRVRLPMARGRDLVSRLIFDKAYSQAMAAENDGVLPVPSLSTQRTTELAALHGGWVLDTAKAAEAHIDQYCLVNGLTR